MARRDLACEAQDAKISMVLTHPLPLLVNECMYVQLQVVMRITVPQ